MPDLVTTAAPDTGGEDEAGHGRSFPWDLGPDRESLRGIDPYTDGRTSLKGTMDHRSTANVVHRRASRVLLGLGLAVSMGLAGPNAFARKDYAEVAKESCKRTSEVKLKAEDAGSGVILVSASVFSEDDDTWDWKLKHNGDVSYKGTVKAKNADRSFRIVKEMADFSGIDDIGFRAQNNATGEVCSLVVSY